MKINLDKKQLALSMLALASLLLIILVIITITSNNQKTSNQPTNEEITIESTQPTQTMQPTDQPQATPTKQTNATASSASTQITKPEMIIDQNKTYTAILLTNKGEITIKLFADKTPTTVNNFVYLAKNDFYDDLKFHRVIKNFMIQGGCPRGDGTGNPGYKFDDEQFEGEYTRGTVAMANSGPNTNGSQFFIMHQDYNLPKNYVIFGEVIDGMETVDEIANTEVETINVGNMSEKSKPVQDIIIRDITIKED